MASLFQSCRNARGWRPSSAYRLLQTLAARGFVEFLDRDQLWAVGVEAFRTGMAFQRRNSIATVAAGSCRISCMRAARPRNIAIFEAGEIVFVAQVESFEPIRAFFRTGERRAAHASGIGKALLAEMPRRAVERIIAAKGLERFTDMTLTEPAAFFADLAKAHVRGWALDDEERNLGMRCIAAAIFNEFGDPLPGCRSPVRSPASMMRMSRASGRWSRREPPRSRGWWEA